MWLFYFFPYCLGIFRDSDAGGSYGPIGGGDMTKFCFLRVGNSSPASGLLVRRSRPGANIEAPPRFNPRSGRVGLFFYFFGFFRFLRGYGGRWSGAGRASVCGSMRWVGFLFLGGYYFFSLFGFYFRTDC